MSNIVEMSVRQPLILRALEREYTLEFPLSAVMWAEEQLKHSLKAANDWFNAPAKDIPTLIHAGLLKHHAGEAEEVSKRLCEDLTPETYGAFAEAMGAVAFPRFTQRWHEQMEALRKRGGDVAHTKDVSAVAH